MSGPSIDAKTNSPAELVAAVEREDWESVVQLVHDNWLSLVVDHMFTLHWVFGALPEDVAVSDELLKAGRNLLRLGRTTGNIPDGDLPGDLASLRDLGRRPDSRDVLVSAMVRIILLRLAGYVQMAAALARKVSVIAAESGRTHGELVVETLPLVRLQIAISQQLSGDFQGSVNDFQHSYQGNSMLGNTALARDAAGKTALSLVLTGKIAEAEYWLAREDELPFPEGWLATTGPIAGLAGRAMVGVERFDRDAAASALAALPVLTPNNEYWGFVAYAFAQDGLVFGSLTEALRQLRDVRFERRDRLGDGVSNELLLSAELELLLALGQGDRAMSVLAKTEVGVGLVEVARARAHLLAGELDEVQSITRRELVLDHTPRVRMELLLILFAAEMEHGDQATALESLSGAVSLSARYGLVRPFASVRRESLRDMVRHVVGLDHVVEELDRSDVRDLYPGQLTLIELTPRELIVLQELSTGASMAEIAKTLFVSLATVKSQQHTLYKKLGVHNRREALKCAYERGLL